jgi:hypothetical protein
MLRLGYCPACTSSFESPIVTDRLCPECQAREDAIYANDPTPPVDTDTRPYTRAAMRERLGVTGNEDI